MVEDLKILIKDYSLNKTKFDFDCKKAKKQKKKCVLKASFPKEKTTLFLKKLEKLYPLIFTLVEDYLSAVVN